MQKQHCFNEINNRRTERKCEPKWITSEALNTFPHKMILLSNNNGGTKDHVPVDLTGSMTRLTACLFRVEES